MGEVGSVHDESHDEYHESDPQPMNTFKGGLLFLFFPNSS